jgi:hypothetical protein
MTTKEPKSAIIYTGAGTQPTGARTWRARQPRRSPPQVMRGHVRLQTVGDSWDGRTGDYLAIPPERHSLDAIEDWVVLAYRARRPIARLPCS